MIASPAGPSTAASQHVDPVAAARVAASEAASSGQRSEREQRAPQPARLDQRRQEVEAGEQQQLAGPLGRRDQRGVAPRGHRAARATGISSPAPTPDAGRIRAARTRPSARRRGPGRRARRRRRGCRRAASRARRRARSSGEAGESRSHARQAYHGRLLPRSGSCSGADPVTGRVAFVLVTGPIWRAFWRGSSLSGRWRSAPAAAARSACRCRSPKDPRRTACPTFSARRPCRRPVARAARAAASVHGAERPQQPPQRRLPDRHLRGGRAARARHRDGPRPSWAASAHRRPSTARAGSSRSASGSTDRGSRCSTRRRSSCSTAFPLPPRIPSPGSGGNPFTDFSGGGYFYLDNQDRAVIPTTTRHIWVIGETADATGARLSSSSATTTSARAVPPATAIISALPDWSGRIWFVSGSGVVGTVDPASGAVQVRRPRRADRQLVRGRRDRRRLHRHRRGAVPVRRGPGRRAASSAGASPTPTSACRSPGQTQAGSGTTPTLHGHATSSRSPTTPTR